MIFYASAEKNRILDLQYLSPTTVLIYSSGFAATATDTATTVISYRRGPWRALTSSGVHRNIIIIIIIFTTVVIVVSRLRVRPRPGIPAPRDRVARDPVRQAIRYDGEPDAGTVQRYLHTRRRQTTFYTGFSKRS